MKETMKLIFKSCQLAFFLSFAVYCSTNKNTGTDAKYSAAEFKDIIAGNTQKTWRFQKVSNNGIEEEFSACAKQVRFIFKSDNSMQDIFPEGMDCPPTSSGSWRFNAAKNEITITTPEETNIATLINASDFKIEMNIKTQEGTEVLILIPAD